MLNLKTVIERATGHYIVSTVDTFDAGLETMVFRCDKSGNVTDYTDLAAARYDTEEEARNGHQHMVDTFVYDRFAN